MIEADGRITHLYLSIPAVFPFTRDELGAAVVVGVLEGGVAVGVLFFAAREMNSLRDNEVITGIVLLVLVSFLLPLVFARLFVSSRRLTILLPGVLVFFAFLDILVFVCNGWR